MQLKEIRSAPRKKDGSPLCTQNAFLSVLARGQPGPWLGCPVSLDRYTLKVLESASISGDSISAHYGPRKMRSANIRNGRAWT